MCVCLNTPTVHTLLHLSVVFPSRTEFARAADASTSALDVPPTLLQVLEYTARTGAYVHEWELLKPLVLARMEQVATEANARNPDCPSESAVHSFDVVRKRLRASVQAFVLAPFTVQRLCEVLLDPTKHYKSTHKLMGSLEKLVTVSSIQQRAPVRGV